MPDAIGTTQPPDSPTQRVVQLLTATLTGLDGTISRAGGPGVLDVPLLLGLHARRIHGSNGPAVSDDVEAALRVIGNPHEPTSPRLLRRRIQIALDEGVTL
ncbi:hypothetical protein [Streptomyces sp. NPDC006784]|uniref:hypothetical protein n=1 Tax=Streptomyces sp. NPDC006784 TaxID=3364764 RepID=UPI0036D11B82